MVSAWPAVIATRSLILATGRRTLVGKIARIARLPTTAPTTV
jgi:hypothetical protein